MQQPGFANARILISDDDPRILDSLRLLLAPMNYQVTMAGDGAAALALLEEKSFDLMLLDLSMPRVMGQQVIDAVRERGLDTAIVVVSGETSADVAVDALRRGANDFLRKPYSPPELLSRIQIVLRELHLQRENRRIQRRLHESEQLHRFFVESSPDLIFLLDGNGRFVFVNASAEKLLGYRPGELLGKHYEMLVHPEDMNAARYSLRPGDGADLSRNLEVRLLARDTAQEACLVEMCTWRVDLSALGVSDAGPGVYGVARDVSDRKKAESIISFQASHDLLTRLPNRFLFKDRLGLAIKQAARDQQGFTVMYVDLDRFKLVNDSLGHVIGDELLQSVATRMKQSLREGDTLARLGGDEFLLLLPRAGTAAAAEIVAGKLLREIEQPFLISGHDLYVSASIGIALYPKHGVTPEALTKSADIAMYAVKAHGRNGFQFYRPEIDDGSSRKLVLATDLHKALESGQLAVHYQPQVDSQSCGITGVEALVRWQHPTLGMLSPAEFLPIAEDTGLIVPVGEWVLKQACSDMRRWRAEGADGIRLAVNFSALQVEHPAFVGTVLAALQHSGLPPEMLEIEVTEDGIMKDMKAVIGKLTQLAQQGVRIAIDDFGTGYSSLSYLRSLPIHTIKIDRSFLQDLRPGPGGRLSEQSIVGAIVNMAGSLQLKSIAEGVETQEQLDFLRGLGCAEAQGFLFSRPVPAEDIAGLLRGGTRAAA